MLVYSFVFFLATTTSRASSYLLLAAQQKSRTIRRCSIFSSSPPVLRWFSSGVGGAAVTSNKLSTGTLLRSNVNSMSTTTTTGGGKTSLDLVGAKGEFTRAAAKWRNWIGRSAEDGSQDVIPFPAESNGRYHLYVSYACPWAHRTLMVRALKGLEHVIGVTVVHPTWQRTRPHDPYDQHSGWIFGTTSDDTKSAVTFTNTNGNGGPFSMHYADTGPDPYDDQAKFIRDVYERAAANRKDGSTLDGGVYSVPILYDSKQHTIVSNESSDIIRMFNTAFNDYAKYPELDLYPPSLQTEIDSVNDWIYPSINNGVYRCGFAKSQVAYDEAIDVLTNGLDRLETLLSKQRYVASNTHITEADVRLFVTLVRYDEVYIVYFKCNTRSIEHSDVLLNYCRDIYQYHPNIAATVNMDHIKTHYFTSHPLLNYYSIIPKGRNFIELLQQPHNRHNMS